MSATLAARVVARAALDRSRREEMLALMRLCYADVSPERFASDLDDKAYVILLFAPGGRLVGFSTLKLSPGRLGTRAVDVVYSGDTVIHPDHWGAKALQTAFGRFLLARKLARPWRPCLWLLLSGGYKTYLMMVNHFPHAWPSRRRAPDAGLEAFRDRTARAWFGDGYDAARGIVRFGASHYRVRQDVVPIDADTAAHPDVAFFLARNPGHADGAELVCLAEVRVVDLVRELGRIMLRRMLRPPRAARRAEPMRRPV